MILILLVIVVAAFIVSCVLYTYGLTILPTIILALAVCAALVYGVTHTAMI